MIEVEAPDGTIVEFPQGTSPDKIKQVMRAQFPARQQKGFGQLLKENLLGDDDPTTQNLGERVGSFLNKAGESMTAGLIGDEASAAVESLLPGVNYADRRDHYRGQERVLEENNPGAALAADIGGAVVMPAGGAGLAMRGARMLPRVAASAGATGALSGLYGFTEGEGGVEERFSDAGRDGATGAAIGAAIPFVGSGVQKLADGMVARRAMRGATKNAPTTEALRSTEDDLWNATRNAGVDIKGDRVTNLNQRMVQALKDRASYSNRPGNRALMPKTTAVMENMADISDEMAGGANRGLPFEEIEGVRRSTKAARADFSNPTDQRGGQIIKSQIDQFINGLGPDDVFSGDLQTLKGAIDKARTATGRRKKAEIVEGVISNAENYQSGIASGIKNQFRSILNSPKKRAGFTEAEIRVMRDAIGGSPLARVLHYAGTGLGNYSNIALGALTGSAFGPAGTIAGALGGVGLTKLAARASDAAALRRAEIARALMAKGGRQSLPKAPELTRTIAEQLLRQGTAAGLQ